MSDEPDLDLMRGDADILERMGHWVTAERIRSAADRIAELEAELEAAENRALHEKAVMLGQDMAAHERKDAHIAELEAMIRADAPGQGTVDYTGGH